MSVVVCIRGSNDLHCQAKLLSVFVLCYRFDVGEEHEGNRWVANVDSISAHPVCPVLENFHVIAHLLWKSKV